jgi:predicted DsbA family dithiol-disulfide isomerase
VLRACAQAAGLDADAMQAEVEGGKFKTEVDRRVEDAHAHGVHAVPTFIVADTYAIQGAQESGVFELALQKLGIAPKSK